MIKEIRLDLLNEEGGVEKGTLWTTSKPIQAELIYERTKRFIDDMFELAKLYVEAVKITKTEGIKK